MSDTESEMRALLAEMQEAVVRAPGRLSDEDTRFRQSWIETFASLKFHATTDDPDCRGVTDAEFEREMLEAIGRRPEIDVDAVIRWLDDWREALAVERLYPANLEPPHLDVPADWLWLLAACLTRTQNDRVTNAVTAFIRVANSGLWPFRLLGESMTTGAAARALEAVDQAKLDEDHWVEFIAAMSRLAHRGDENARSFIRSLNEELLPRKAKGELRAARFHSQWK